MNAVKRHKRTTPCKRPPFQIDQTNERLIDAVVAANITTREHAERVISRGERSVIEAWTRKLAVATEKPEFPYGEFDNGYHWRINEDAEALS